MNHFALGLSALPVFFAVATLAPGCGDTSTDCASRATCSPVGSGGRGGGAQGGAAQGGQGEGGAAQGGQGGSAQGGAAQGGAAQGGQGGSAMASCVPWENGAGIGIPAICGTFVASAGGTTGDGSLGNPYGTVAEALATAQSGDSIYLCSELFVESVVVPSGVILYGGLDCSSGWTFVPGTQTLLTGVANEVAARFADGTETTSVYDLRLSAPNASTAGGSSIAALVEGGTVHFGRVEVIAGNGAVGAQGLTPTDMIGPSDPNDPAIRGAGPTSGTCGNSGPAPTKVNPFCAGPIGGASGRGSVSTAAIFEPALSGNPGQVSGGAGGVAVASCPACSGICPTVSCCAPGTAGGAGSGSAMGGHATGAVGAGVLTISGWVGVTGGTGSRGGHGSGGGGAAGATLVNPGQLSCANGGNGGGAGGCGGYGGGGGGFGGASLAVIVLNGIFSTTDGSLSTGEGGRGGSGGAGQLGAVGGNGGTGGSCGGGVGGTGGAGGTGGGGTGGPSLVIAHTSAATINFGAATVFSLGTSGLGGTGGDTDGQGAAGAAQQLMELALQ